MPVPLHFTQSTWNWRNEQCVLWWSLLPKVSNLSLILSKIFAPSFLHMRSTWCFILRHWGCNATADGYYTNWPTLHKVAPLEEKNISTCCPRCVLPDYMLCWSICVNNNKLLTVNPEKTTVGSKFRRICMGNVSFYNSGSFQHPVFKLSRWENQHGQSCSEKNT